MSGYIYVEYNPANELAIEKQGYANLIRSIATMRRLSTLWNCQTDNHDDHAILTDADLTSDKYPLLYDRPAGSHNLSKDPVNFTDKCFSFLPMVNGNICAIVPKTKDIILDTGEKDEEGNVIHAQMDVDFTFIVNNTGYITIHETVPELVPPDFSGYE